MGYRILINHVTWQNVGHLIEILKIAYNFYKSNIGLQIFLLVNANTPYEITDTMKWINKIIPVDVDDVWRVKEKAQIFQIYTQLWDFIFFEDRLNPENSSEKLVYFNEMSKARYNAKIWIGSSFKLQRFPIHLQYHKDFPFIIENPSPSTFSFEKLGGQRKRFCILLGNSFPPTDNLSITMWEMIIQAILNNWPETLIFLTGQSKSINQRSFTKAYSLDDVNRLHKIPGVYEFFDMSIWEQIDLIRKSNIFISPHSGFGFIAACVRTPYLIISSKWEDFFVNQTPFYNVFPDCPNYPCANKLKPKCKQNQRENSQIECLNDKLTAKIPQILNGIRKLLDPEFNFQTALKEFHVNLDRHNLKEKYVQYKLFV